MTSVIGDEKILTVSGRKVCERINDMTKEMRLIKSENEEKGDTVRIGGLEEDEWRGKRVQK